MNKKKIKGFSLIELIVVMTIIAVLTVIGAISFSATNKKSRDGRRQADIEKIRMALEMYKQEMGVYPTSEPGLSPKYISEELKGPKQDDYIYVPAASVDPTDETKIFAYELYAYMEDTADTNGNYSYTCGTGLPCNYKVVSP